MMRTFGIAMAALSAVTAVSAVTPLDPIVIKGSKFFYKSNGTQFFMKGVAYQPDVSSTTGTQKFVDPLADATACARDIPLMTALGTNTIRVYSIDTTVDHTACLNLLQSAGIYIVADLSEPGTSINRDEPQWNLDLYARYTAVVDTFAPYTNVLGFFAGNEVTNNNTNTDASPFVKAAVRDMKAYIKSKNYRTIPVGYATNDDDEIRGPLADYFNCGDAINAIDFWGYNIYSWCGKSTIQQSGYDVRTAEYANYSVPVFFAEYGCNEVRPRLFTEVEALYGSQMTPVWSGGIVYMYYEETNKFGLVDISSGKASKLPDYNNLQSELAKISPTGVKMSSYNPTNTAARACPATGVAWSASTLLPPTPDKALCDCMVSSLGCVPSSSVKEADYADLFSFICTKISCAGINANGTSGAYGAYSNCAPSARLAWAMNQYYVSQNSASDACAFSGQGKIQTSSTSSSCGSKISSAGGSAGTSATSSGSGTSGSSSATSKSAAIGSYTPSSLMPFISLMAVVFTAAMGGAGMVML